MILQHPYILQSPISNLCLKGSLDNNADTQFFPKLLLHLSVRELNNSIVILPEEDRLKEARNPDNNIIISDFIIHNILPPQLKKITALYKVICGFKYWIYTKIIHYSLLTWRFSHLKQLKDMSNNEKYRRSGEIEICISETYKISVRPHGFHI